jgi:hypothetical protein
MQEKNRASCNKEGGNAKENFATRKKEEKKEVAIRKRTKKHQEKNKTCYMKKKRVAKKNLLQKAVSH